MTQSDCQCGCDHPQLTMLPVRGISLAVDASGLIPAPIPTPTPNPEIGCRERVTEDLHIYIDGNLETSGDGLTPQTAVKSYEDAVLALSRYDGCNLYRAHLHFMSLQDQDTTYPDFTMFHSHYASFSTVYISGESHETTKLGSCTFHMGSVIYVSNISMKCICGIGSCISLTGNISFKPQNVPYVIQSSYGGCFFIIGDANIIYHNTSSISCVHITHSMLFCSSGAKFSTVGNVTVSSAFFYIQYNGSVTMGKTVDFSGCTGVIGKKYRLLGLSYINSAGNILPGTQDPMVETGSLYV